MNNSKLISLRLENYYIIRKSLIRVTVTVYYSAGLQLQKISLTFRKKDEQRKGKFRE